MRLRLATGIVCLPLLVPACFSTQTDDTAAPSLPMDGGGDDAQPGVDATTVVPMEAAAAPPEASTPDAVAVVPDATMAPPTTVTVVVVGDYGPEPGVNVIFQDATGVVVSTAVTDASGTATAAAVAGSQVTATFGSGLNLQLVTIGRVAPGDVLTMYDATATNNANAVVNLDSLPDTETPGGADTYILNVGPCQTYFDPSALPAELTLSPDCESRGKFPVLVRALSSDTSTEVGYAYQTGNVLASDGGVTHVSLNGSWSAVGPTQTINVSNFDSANVTGYSTFSEIADGVATGAPLFLSSDGDGGASNSSLAHPGFPVSVQSEANVTAGRPGGAAVSAIATRSAPSADGGVSNFDLSSLLPLLDAVNIDATQPARPVVSWVTEAGSLAGGSGTIVNFSWTYVPDGGDTVTVAWTILAPPAAASATAPALPPSLSAWTPGADAQFSSSPPVVIVVAGSGALAPDYAHLRAQFSALPSPSSLLYGDLSLDAVIPPLPADGTLKLTAFTTGE